MASGRVVGIVALCAVAAVAAIVGGTLLLSRHESTTPQGAITKPRPGTPVLQLELGLRRDAEARALFEAQQLLDAKKPEPAQAAAIFQRYSSVEARLGLAFARWTGPGSLAAVQAIANANPDDPAVLDNLGLAELQAGHVADAASTLQELATRYPDSAYAVDALDTLHAGDARHPRFVPGLPYILADPKLVPAAARADFKAGLTAWDLKHVVTARKLLAAAAKRAPDSPETAVAAAVSLFSPSAPKAPFPQLGPLTARFPQAAIVRLQLGVLLLWNLEKKKAAAQLRLAVAEEPKSGSATQARAFLEALGHT